MSAAHRLRQAIWDGEPELIDRLLSAAPELVDAAGGAAALVLEAARAGHPGLLGRLADRGLSLDAALPDGLTPLQTVAREGDRAAAQALLRAGATLDAFSAVAMGADDHVLHLLEATPRLVTVTDGQGATLLHWAVLLGRVELAKELLRQGAEVDAEDQAGDTPLRLLLDEEPETLKGPLAELLVEHGAHVDVVLAAALGLTVALRYWLTEHPESHAAVERGLSLVHWAAWTDEPAALNLLLDQGLAVDVRDEAGWTPLHRAARRGHAAAARVLLARGADPHAADPRDRTPLDIAAARGDTAMVALLADEQRDA